MILPHGKIVGRNLCAHRRDGNTVRPRAMHERRACSSSLSTMAIGREPWKHKNVIRTLDVKSGTVFKNETTPGLGHRLQDIDRAPSLPLRPPEGFRGSSGVKPQLLPYSSQCVTKFPVRLDVSPFSFPLSISGLGDRLSFGLFLL